MKLHGHGIYQCFCTKHGTISDFLDKTSFCHDYQQDKTYGSLLSISVSVLISIINTVIGMVNIYLTKKIGLNYNSELINNIMQQVFMAQFINTGILLLLVNANFEHSFLSFIPIRNTFSDFSSVWYLTIGKSIVMTMAIASFMPYAGFMIAVVTKLLLRAQDSSFTCFSKVPKTKKITVPQYETLYSGPEVQFHLKYSSMMYMVFVTFTHGIALPILFPISCFAMCNMYIIEKLQFAYFYRQPPLLDNSLNDSSLRILQKAPLFMLCFGYWQLGNR